MIERQLDIQTKDGKMTTFICHPERGGPLDDFAGDAPGAENTQRLPIEATRLRVLLLVPSSRLQIGRVLRYPPVER